MPLPWAEGNWDHKILYLFVDFVPVACRQSIIRLRPLENMTNLSFRPLLALVSTTFFDFFCFWLVVQSVSCPEPLPLESITSRKSC